MKQKASSFVKVVSEKDNDDTDSSMCVISKRIKDEVCSLHYSKEEYHVIDGDNLFNECSDTLMSFLSKLSPNFEKNFAHCYDRKYHPLCNDKTIHKIATGPFSPCIK